MSLLAWYPLISDMSNQGVGDADLTVTSTPTFSPGKLGNALSAGGDAKWTAAQTAKILNNSALSIAFWIKVTGTGSAMIFGNDPMPANNNRKFSIFQYPTANDLHWSWMNDTASTTFLGGIITGAFPTNEWTHVCFVYNNPSLSVYINGTLRTTGSGVSSSASFSYETIVTRACTDRQVCDYRFYNHALSAKEVKEIAKGLVVHYPLSRPQENLAKNSADLTQWGKESGVTVTWDNSVQMFKITDTTHTSSRWGAYQDFNCAANTTYTYSVTGKSVDDAVYLSVGSGAPSSWPSNHGQFTATPTRMSYTFTTGANDTTIRMYLAVYPTESGSRTAYFSFPKLELGSVATPWCPATTDTAYSVMGYNNNIEYDCSGYKNNGAKNGTFAYSSNTARYNSSTIFNGSDNAIVVPFNNAIGTEPTDYTISVWTYKTVIGSKGYQTIFGGPSGFELEARNGSTGGPMFVTWNWGKVTYSYNFNEWTLFTFVRTASDSKLYVNGQFIGTGTTGTVPTGTYFVGAWNSATQQNFEGQMSDFRIYATALSAEAIKELYNTPVSIANNGTMLTQGEFVES